MKKINLPLIIIFMLAVSGCVTGAKAVRPSPREIVNPPPEAIEEKNILEISTIASNNIVSPPMQTTPQNIESYTAPKPPQEPPKIRYSQIMNLISEFINMKKNSIVSGEDVYSGVSENKLTSLEIKGDKNDVKEASMKLMYPQGIDKASAELNRAMMARFLKNAAPEFMNWNSRAKEILNKFYSMKAGVQGITRENIELNNKIIQILYDKNLEYIVVTLKPQP